MNTDPTSLNRLHDIVAPSPVPWWPPAPGWYWVLGFLLIVLLVLILALFLRWQRNRYRREALEIWKAEFGQLSDPNSRAPSIVRLTELLKRTALSAFPRDEVAGLTGAAWFSFLDRTAANSSFSAGNGKLLEGAAYDSVFAATVDEAQARAVASEVQHWI